MNSYNIITVSKVTTKYIVKAKNEEEAREKYYDGEIQDSNIINYYNEQVETIERN